MAADVQQLLGGVATDISAGAAQIGVPRSPSVTLHEHESDDEHQEGE